MGELFSKTQNNPNPNGTLSNFSKQHTINNILSTQANYLDIFSKKNLARNQHAPNNDQLKKQIFLNNQKLNLNILVRQSK
jgi:hypothetical protein